MSEHLRSAAGDPHGARHRSSSGPVVLLACLLLVAGHTAFRGWAAFGAWYHEDDFEFVRYSLEQPFGLDYLMEPHTGHLMPLGRLLIDLSVATGVFNWPATAAVTVALQAVVGLSAFWMLRTLFGLRWGIVPPLVVFLVSPITMPTTVWWAVALNQQAQQIGLMCAVGCWVLYERTGRLRWLALTLAAVLLALAADIRGLMIPPVLAAISLGWFETGHLGRRLLSLVRRLWAVGVVAGLLCVGTIAYYVAYVPLTTTDTDWSLLGPLASQMLGTAYATGVVGGPWNWLSPEPPAAFADPPQWSVHLSWVFIAAVLAHAYLTRRRTLRAWALLLGSLLVLLLLLWSSRAPFVGTVAGNEYRYLTEAAAMSALCLGLAYLDLVGAKESSTARPAPMFTPRIPVQVPLALAGIVALLGTWSSTQFALIWHDHTAGRDYVNLLSRQLERTGPVALADTGVPRSVGVLWLKDRLPKLVEILSPDSHFPDAAHDLVVVAPSGLLTHADLDVATSTRAGPKPGCGWKIKGRAREIPLAGTAIDRDWWIRIDYLAPQEVPATVRAGDSPRIDVTLKPGLNRLFVRTQAGFDTVEVDTGDPSLTVCVETVEVGTITPGAPLT